MDRTYIFILIGVLIVLVVGINGFTSNTSDSTQTYENENMSFEYPSDWTLNSSKNNGDLLIFKVDNDVVIRVELSNIENSILHYESYPETGKAGDNEYRLYKTEGNRWDTPYSFSYAIRKDGKEFNVLGAFSMQNDIDEDGMLKVVETFKLK